MYPFSVNAWTNRDGGNSSDENSAAKYAFLTHCHTDHTSGIERFHKPIMCSEVTKRLLLLKHPHIHPGRIISLDYGRTYNLTRSMSVSMYDAGHCPGSSCFLFEGTFGNVFHTGDARLEPRTTDAFPASIYTKPNYIDRLFLDATFGGRDVLLDAFPSREESAEAVAKIAYDFPMATHPRVDLCAGMLGTEPLIKWLADYWAVELICPAECATRKAELMITLTDCYLIDDESASFMHMWDPKHRPTRSDAVSIRPTTRSFVFRDNGSAAPLQTISPMVKRLRTDGSFAVLFSMHSSKNELRSFLSRVMPKSVTTIAGSISSVSWARQF
jgi:DNA cross-link repair 1A protein